MSGLPRTGRLPRDRGRQFRITAMGAANGGFSPKSSKPAVTRRTRRYLRSPRIWTDCGERSIAAWRRLRSSPRRPRHSPEKT